MSEEACQWHVEKPASRILEVSGQLLPVCEECYEALGLTKSDQLVSRIFTEREKQEISSGVDTTPQQSTGGSQGDTRKASGS
jgi:hypothetical protein